MARKRNPFAPSEDQITAAVVDHWKAFGVPSSLVASIPNKRAFGQPGLRRGLADLLVLAPDLPVGFIELKRDEDSVVSDEQREFGKLCMWLGIRYAVAVGRDEPIKLLEQWGAARPASPINPPRDGLAKRGAAVRGMAKQGKDMARLSP